MKDLKKMNTNTRDRIETIKMYLNLDAGSKFSNAFLREVEKVINTEIMSQEEFYSFSGFCRANRDNEKILLNSVGTTADPFGRWDNALKLWSKDREEKKNQARLEYVRSNLDFLIVSINAISPKIKQMIDRVDSLIYSSRVINPRSPIFDARYKYEYLVGVVKNYCSKVGKAYTSDIEKKVLVEMFDKNILTDEICEFANMHSSSIADKVEMLQYKVKKIRDSGVPDSIEAYNNQIRKMLNQQSTYADFRKSIVDSLMPMMPQIKDALEYNYEDELNFKKFEKVSINGKNPFNQKAIKTLNKIGFREIYNMSEKDLREALRKEVLGVKSSTNQISSNADRVKSLIGKSTIPMG
jgi:hypothetical protein